MTPSKVYKTPWLDADADLDGAVIIGRATIDYPNGGRTHGLLVTRQVVIELELCWVREVVYFDRRTGVFSTERLPDG